jgi:hypothetical protein
VIIPDSVLFAVLNKAAQAKGSPLSDVERAAARHDALREAYRIRFTNVIRLAGYKNDAPDTICAAHIDEYLKDLGRFDAMLTDYEQRYADLHERLKP